MSDDPLDLSALAADDEAIEALRTGRPLPGEDRVLQLMRDLRADVERGLPELPPVVIAPAAARRGGAMRSGAVAAVTVGLLSLTGAAAASTLAPDGSPLHGLGEVVRSAADAVAGAVTRADSAGRPGVALPTGVATPTAARQTSADPADAAPRQPTPGAAVAAAARSRAAARQVDQLLDQAEQLLAAGRTTPAARRLDLAERKLAEVLPGDRGALPVRLTALRARVSSAPTAGPERTAKPERTKPPAAPATQSEQKGKPEKRGSSRSTAPGSQPEGKGGGDGSGKGVPKGDPKNEGSAGKDAGSGNGLLRQPSSDASTNPRA